MILILAYFGRIKWIYLALSRYMLNIYTKLLKDSRFIFACFSISCSFLIL
jgi:hypothetical protein